MIKQEVDIRRISPERMTPNDTSPPVMWLPHYEARDMGFETNGWGGARNPTGVRVTPDNAIESTVVLACIRCLAESVASLKLSLFKEKKGVRETDSANPMNKLIASKPNNRQTSFEWREQGMLWLGLYGNWYNQIVRGPGDLIQELVPLHPSRMKVEEVEDGSLRYTYSESSGGSSVYSQEDIVHVRWMSNDGIEGMIPTSISKDAIALARACELHGSRFFGNGARPGVILQTPNQVTPESASLLREAWERAHRGVDNSWKTAVLTNGLEAKELGLNNTESQYLEVRRFQVEEICRTYRVPPHLVMDLNRATFSNIEQQSLDFLQYTLTPWLKRLEQAFDRDLLGDDGAHYFEFDTKTLLRGDAASRASWYTSMWNLGVLSVNEIRSAEGLNPVDNGDERFVQLNMTTLDKAEEPTTEEVEVVQEIQEPVDTEQAQTEDDLPPADEQPLAQTAFTGVQIQQLVDISQQVATGILPRDSAIEIILQAFPTIDRTEAERIVPEQGSAMVEEEPQAQPVTEAPIDGTV